MSRFVLALAAFLFATLTLSACDYGQRGVCAAVQVQAAPVYQQAQVYQAQAIVPQYAQVVVPTVASFAQVQYAPAVQQVVVQKQFVQRQVYAQQSFAYGYGGGFQAQRQFVGGGFGGRQRAFGGGGIGSGGIINAASYLLNSPAGLFTLGGFVGRGFRFR
jgi:uncharacterized membrane protein YgcG